MKSTRNIHKYLLPLGAILVATSCADLEPTPDPCGSFPAALAEAANADLTVEEFQASQAVEDAMARIEHCYPEMTYSREGPPLLFERVSFGSDRKIYIFYGFRGVTDDMIVFRLQPNGKIDAAFSYSPLSRFAAPD